MTIEFVKLRGGMTVDVAMKQIKRTGMDKETIYTCYVIDGQRKLIGVVPLRTLICAKDEELVQDLMEEDVVSVHTTDDQEEVCLLYTSDVYKRQLYFVHKRSSRQISPI